MPDRLERLAEVVLDQRDQDRHTINMGAFYSPSPDRHGRALGSRIPSKPEVNAAVASLIENQRRNKLAEAVLSPEISEADRASMGEEMTEIITIELGGIE